MSICFIFFSSRHRAQTISLEFVNEFNNKKKNAEKSCCGCRFRMMTHELIRQNYGMVSECDFESGIKKLKNKNKSYERWTMDCCAVMTVFLRCDDDFVLNVELEFDWIGSPFWAANSMRFHPTEWFQPLNTLAIASTVKSIRTVLVVVHCYCIDWISDLRLKVVRFKLNAVSRRWCRSIGHIWCHLFAIDAIEKLIDFNWIVNIIRCIIK